MLERADAVEAHDSPASGRPARERGRDGRRPPQRRRAARPRARGDPRAGSEWCARRARSPATSRLPRRRLPPEPEYSEPEPAYQEPEPVYQEPEPAYAEPEPAPEPQYAAPQPDDEPQYAAPQPEEESLKFQGDELATEDIPPAPDREPYVPEPEPLRRA